MAQQKVLLVGASGETGTDILEGLLEDGNLEVSCLVRPASADSSGTQFLKAKGLKIVIADITGPPESLAPSLKGYDTIISAVGAWSQLQQLGLVEAIALAGVGRFVPCGFMTICPRGGIMKLRDDKEQVHDGIFKHKIPYTIIDVGYWHQISLPRVPSGKLDYALLFTQPPIVYGDGRAKNLLTDKRDIGRFVAKIIQDPRTLNKRVFTYSDELSQNEINTLMEKYSGEKLEAITVVSKEELIERTNAARAAQELNPDDINLSRTRTILEYQYSKYIRGDNTIANAKYLGYIDARELYPDFKPITFEELLPELLAGRSLRPYSRWIPKS